MKSPGTPAVRRFAGRGGGRVMHENNSETGEAAGSCSLALEGKCGTESAAALLENARQALARAGDVSVRCATLESIDTRAIQILLALQRELAATGRGFGMVDVPEAIARQLAATGLSALVAPPPDGANDGAP
jgi:anti-anti-sigma regulatory factor